jgi:hypothetical protein
LGKCGICGEENGLGTAQYARQGRATLSGLRYHIKKNVNETAKAVNADKEAI